MTAPAATAHHKFCCKAPMMIVNSPMKPFSNGKPIEERVMIRKTTAYIGMTLESPPNCAISRMPSFIDDADDQEQRARRDSVIDLLDDASIQAIRVQCKHAERNEAHVAHRRVGNELLHVRLHHRDQRPIDDGDNR